MNRAWKALSPRAGLAILLAGALASGCGTQGATQGSPAAPPAPSLASSPNLVTDAGAPEAGEREDAGTTDSAAGDDAAGLLATPGEHWTDRLRSDESCRDYRADYALSIYTDPNGSERKFGYDGYGYREVEVTREIDGTMRRHCVRVFHPRGDTNTDKRRVHVAGHIDPAWYRLLERTLARLPWWHLQQVERIVIDNRPILHGVASFSRGASSEDARDGHTIWLHEHLFTGVSHWAPGNYGKYWAYHVQRDNVAVDGQPPEHDWFSPVLLHEIGHLVNYNVVNAAPDDPACPPCAVMCGDTKTCDKLDAAGKEAPCATSYCTGFGYESGTENWAEMYRWYYQGSATRALLKETFPRCYMVFEGGDPDAGINQGLPAPWERGLGETEGYHRTLWASCQLKPCKNR